jgi:hypothetical protein
MARMEAAVCQWESTLGEHGPLTTTVTRCRATKPLTISPSVAVADEVPTLHRCPNYVNEREACGCVGS